VDLGAIFYIERQKEKKNPKSAKRKTADVSWPGFVLVLVAASAANIRSPLFFAAMYVLAAWGLWAVRPKKRSALAWAVALMVAGALGFAGHVGLRSLHMAIDRAALSWYMAAHSSQRNPLRNVTAIGEVGTLKRSNRIVMRVGVEGPLPGSGLLRDASYSIYRAGRWIAAETAFVPVPPAEGKNAWRLAQPPAPEAVDELRVAMALENGAGFLPVPMGTARIENLPAQRVEKNRFGAVRVLQAPEWVRYRIRFGPIAPDDAPPGALDLDLPEKQAPVVNRVASSLALDEGSTKQAVSRIQEYFSRNFTYSLTQERRRWGVLPLEQFLFETRSGHCEYFATATVLLLRAAGIPARYAVGYRVAEFSRLEQSYLVRSRHAHSWAQAFFGGRWQIVDTTPAQWAALEEKQASAWLPVVDLFRWIGFQVQQWRFSEQKGNLQRLLLWLLVPLVLVLVWRIVFQKRASTLREKAEPLKKSIAADPGAERLAGIDARLAEEGFERRAWETQLQRLQRLSDAGADPAAVSGLKEILHLHYRDRFHPGGIGKATAEDLKGKISAWRAAYDATNRLFRIGSLPEAGKNETRKGV
jgi:hypothetical protein